MIADLLDILPDVFRVGIFVLYSLFIGGAIRVLFLYRRKNRVYRQRTSGKNRPMFKHVVRVSAGTVLITSSAITHNVENIGEGPTLYIPLNLVAMYFLYTAMTEMIAEATHKEGWLKPAQNGDPDKVVDQVIGDVLSDPDIDGKK